MSITVCYLNGDRKKAVLCKHPERICDANCPEWHNRKGIERFEPTAGPAEATETEEIELEQFLADWKKSIEALLQTNEEKIKAMVEGAKKDVNRCESAIDKLIGLTCCNGGYAQGKCPDPQTRPCIVEGKVCRYLLLTVPYFQR